MYGNITYKNNYYKYIVIENNTKKMLKQKQKNKIPKSTKNIFKNLLSLLCL